MKTQKLHSILFFVFLFTVMNVSVTAQNSAQEAENQYEQNIRKRYINDAYIPKDMDDCFVELKRLSSPGAIQKFKAGSEAQISQKLHFGLGKWMSKNWNFYEGSRFSHYLKSMGVSYPDDMVQFTIVSFHKHLNEKPLELEKRAESYFNSRKKAHLAKLNSGKIIETKKRKKQ